MFQDTIVAISSSVSESALSVIRISGSDAIVYVNQIMSRNIMKTPSHQVVYGHIIDPADHREVDEVLVSVFRAPKTYTREDVVEIGCHGGYYVTRKIIALLLGTGARLAARGEFTQRAFLNGRLDLTQAEAVMDIIQADSANQAQLALHALHGSIRKRIAPLKEEVLQMIAQIEVNIDYPEYTDVAELTKQDLLPKAYAWRETMQGMLKASHSHQIIKEGIKTVILGKPNVGKSSLLNALLQEDKAIVTNIAGTTRDIVEGYVQVGGFMLHILDTAGIRKTDDRLEQLGIDKSKKVMEEADLVIVVLDGSQCLDEEDVALLTATAHKNRIIVCNKADQAQGILPYMAISALKHTIAPLLQEIEAMFAKHTIALIQPSLANERQFGLLTQSAHAMQAAIDALENEFALDLVTIDLQISYKALQALLGEDVQADLLDELFSRFCLGK